MMLTLNRRSLLLGATALGAIGVLRPTLLAAAERTNHAVLVSCTVYPNLKPSHALIGPNNDAKLVRDYLTSSAPVKFAGENVTVLADNLDGAAESATHANILKTFAAVADKAQPGDFVYIHMSGHGSRQIARDKATETDGEDEIFLAQDTGFPTDDSGRLPNALVDDDMGSALAAIRAKGAFVWIVFDCCCSGTATRAALIDDGQYQHRMIDPTDLGITQAQIDAARGASGTRSSMESEPTPSFALGGQASSAVANEGKMVAFYAAQSTETTPEMPLPPNVEGAARYGLFTFSIFSQLAQNPNLTYRQLAQSVLQTYAAGGLNSPTPLFEGELDAQVFGSEPKPRVLQWPLTVADGAATLPAGMLHRLAPGSKLALVASADADTAAALGYVEVVEAQNVSSTVKPVAFADKPAPDLGALPPATLARLTDVAVDFKLKVARPAVEDGLDKEVALVNATLDQVTTAKTKLFDVELVEPGKEADIRLAVMRENKIPGALPGAGDQPALWFLPASGEFTPDGVQKPPLVAIYADQPEKLAAATNENLQKIFRATSLARVGVATGAGMNGVDIAFNVRRLPAGKARLSKEEWESVPLEAMQGSNVPTINPEDRMNVQATNKTANNVDLNVLYIGSDYSISQVASERLVPGATLGKDLFRFTDQSFGVERMVAVLTEAPAQSAQEDLKYLEQGGVRQATRAAIGPTNSFKSMLEDIGAAPGTRSAASLDDEGASTGGGVMSFSLRTKPRN